MQSKRASEMRACRLTWLFLIMPLLRHAAGQGLSNGINVSFQVHGIDWLNVSKITFANYSVFILQNLLTYNINTTQLNMVEVYFTIFFPSMMNVSWIRFNNGPVFVRVMEQVHIEAVRNPNTLVVLEIPGLSWQAFSLQRAIEFLHGTVRNNTLRDSVLVSTTCPSNQFLVPGTSECRLCSRPGIEQYLAQACTAAADSVLARCQVCTRLQYEACPCSPNAGAPPCTRGDRLCLPMASPTCPAGFYIGNRSRCLPNPCPVGSTGVPLACTICPAGGFKNTTGNTPCLPCPAGRYSMGNASVCAACAAGYFSTGTWSTACEACRPGYYSKNSAGACTSCASNTYAPSLNASACLACSPGTFSNGTGKSTCVLCPAGQGLNSVGLACTACVPGTYWQGGSCLDCSSGTYSTGKGMIGRAACKTCMAGKFTLTKRASVCFPCLPGTHGANCADCPKGTYQPASGATFCVRCIAGQYTLSTGGSSELACLNCESGTYFDGNETCMACPNFTTSPAGAVISAECRSLPGYFARRQGDIPEICPANHFCPLGTTQPAACPHGLTSESGSSACSIPTHSVLLFEIIVIIIWAILFVLALWYYVHSRLRKEEQTRTAAIIRLRLGHTRS